MEGLNTRLLLVSANVGSIFEDPEHMLKIWLKEFLAMIQKMEPGLVALHCQEVGGKNYEASMQHVNQFVKAMLGSDELQKYDRARVFLDEDYTAADKFTALGNLYFIHECIEDVMIYDFIECKFIQVEGREVLSGNIENIQIKEKAKYPQNFFPEFKWSRKGFLRTRWSINNCVFDLINIHLFHDASNIVAMQKSPSTYVENRHRALSHTLKRFETDQLENVPYFIFGDFNFRLDLNMLLKELTEKTETHETRGKKDQISKIVYTETGNSKVVLTVESKYFDHHEKHNEVFSNKKKLLNKYDTELLLYKDKVYEYDVDFPPSYPFSEDVNDGISYMKTRCPSWCDRILLSHSSKDIIFQDEKHKPKYHIIGKDVCMGDHKPVYLSLLLKKGKGNDFEFQPQSSKKLRKRLSTSTSISVNGEKVDADTEDVNIHDYATFEKEEQLIPEFRISIKSKSGKSLLRENSSDAGLTRKSSFKDVARQIVSMESVLKKWPRRPRSRHHSSSSEDIAEDEDNRDRDVTPDDDVSVHTDTSELSDNEEMQRDLSPEEIDIHTASIAGSISLTDGSCANINGNRINVAGDLSTETHMSTPKMCKDADIDKSKKHGKGVVTHEHGSDVSKDSNTDEETAKKRSSAFRCPCVVL